MSSVSTRSYGKRKPPRRLTRNPFERVFPRRGSSTVSVSSISSTSGGAAATERFPLQIYRSLKGALNANKTYSFSQSVEVALGINGTNGFTSGTGGTIYGNGLAMIFSLQYGLQIQGNISSPANSALAQYTSFTTLFDQYRISAVEVTLSMSRNSESATTAVGTAPTSDLPLIHSVVDYDDATPPGTSATMLQYAENNIWQVGNKGTLQKKWLIRPHFAVAAYQGAFTGYAQAKPTDWVDSGYPAVQYYGLKLWADSFPGTLQLGYATFHCRFFLEFKNCK